MNWLGTPGSGWVGAMVTISELDVHDDRAPRASTQRLNRGLGFRLVELVHEMQREDPRADG
jgi:hypothetical protein